MAKNHGFRSRFSQPSQSNDRSIGYTWSIFHSYVGLLEGKSSINCPFTNPLKTTNNPRSNSHVRLRARSPRPLVPSSPRPLHPWPRYQRAGPEAMGIINGGIYGWNDWYMVRDALGKSIHRDITGNTATNIMALLDSWLYDQVTACFHRETNENWNWSHPKTKTI